MSNSAVWLGAGVGLLTVPVTLLAGNSYGPVAAVVAVALVGIAVAMAVKTA
ncbi:hypothetical protein HUG10_08590 [Halorarum halophilum]|uniref:Uncharacterized protein n=1 Tax=Halorarum halophilum TaxID=2743090 RepID=A0A7D5GBR6_9EURY|nr:hypothetical protein [Halobaculum halophilum]QLG27605.1 hypothetical protein HUG10_08590 [Halobaculum halophilum]